MARRPFAALGVFASASGSTIIVRKVLSKKQGTWLLICEGPHVALRQLLPDWRPRAPSTRTQITPPTPIRRVSDIISYYNKLVPAFYERLAGKPVPLLAPSAAPSYRTLGELMRLVEREAETTLRAGSLTTYRYQGAALIRVLPPDTLLVELNRERLQGVIGELATNYASTTVINIRNLLAKLMARAVEDRVLVANPLAKVRCPKPVARLQTPLTRPQREEVLREAEARGRDVHLLFHLLLGTGVRRSEALALTWQDVDLEHRLLHVRSSDHFLTKTGGARSVPIPGELFGLLSRSARAAGFVLKPDQPYGNGRYRWDFSKVFAAVVRAAGVPDTSPHTCRHHYSSWFLENGGTLFRLAAYLGHTLLETTEGYAHLVPGFGSETDGGSERPAPRIISA